MQRLQDLQTFVLVADNLSISRAAEHLGVSKSVVSRRLQALEQRLGMRLLNRSTRQVALTDAGHVFYVECSDIVGRIDALEANLAERSREVSGKLRISAPVSFAIQHLVEPISRFAASYPALSCDVLLEDRYVDVVAEQFDAAIRVGELADSNLVARQLGRSKRLACASPSYLAARGEPRTPRELKRHSCLIYTEGGGTNRGNTWHFGAEKKKLAVKVQGPLRTNNGEMLRAAAEQGLGITVLPRFFVTDALPAGRLTPVLTDYSLPEVGIYVVFPHSKLIAPALRGLIDFLSQEFRGKAL